jgi:hypothetical protein
MYSGVVVVILSFENGQLCVAVGMRACGDKIWEGW